MGNERGIELPDVVVSVDLGVVELAELEGVDGGASGEGDVAEEARAEETHQDWSSASRKGKKGQGLTLDLKKRVRTPGKREKTCQSMSVDKDREQMTKTRRTTLPNAREVHLIVKDARSQLPPSKMESERAREEMRKQTFTRSSV